MTPSPAIRQTVTPTLILQIINLDEYIGNTIPPLPDGLVEIFGISRIFGESNPNGINFYVLLVQGGQELSLWLGVPYMEENTFSGKITITDIVEISALADNEKIIPFYCDRFGTYRWGIVAIVQSSDTWPTDNIVQAWIIQPSSSKFIPITSDGVECYEYPFLREPILQWFND